MKLIKPLLLSLLLCSSGARAEWLYYGETDNSTFYIDLATIRKEGNLRRVWEVLDLKQRRKDGELSYRVRNEYDCKQERYRILSITSHSGQMAKGEILESSSSPAPWRDIPPDTTAKDSLKLVCTN